MDILRIHNSVNGELLIQGCDGIEAAIKCGIEPEIDTTEIDMRYQRERAATKDTTSKALITRRFESKAVSNNYLIVREPTHSRILNPRLFRVRHLMTPS